MGVVTQIRDGLQSIVANLGTTRDKAATLTYEEPMLDDEQVMNAYRGSWLAQNIIDIPADDSTREWRDWKADAGQIEAIEGEEKRLGLQGKVREARRLARLWGGAAIYISVKGQDPAEPFDPATVRKGGIDQLTVFTRHDLMPTEIETDPMSEWYGKPRAYMISNATGNLINVRIHPSRLAIFYGKTVPLRGNTVSFNRFWGDSVLLAVMNAVKHAEGTAANIASLIFEAKIDVISIEGLMQRANEPQFQKTIQERFSLATTAKGNNGTLILDKGEDYQQKTMNFATLPDILNTFMQVVAGAARIPATVLLGTAPQGMNATGVGDYRNHLDRIKTEQDLDMSPAMKRLDESLIWSALGSRPPAVWYDWSPIWTEPPKDKADIFKAKVDAVRALAGGTGQQPIIAIDALSEATVNMLEEDGTLVGIAAAVKEFGTLAEQEPSAEEQAAALTASGNELPRIAANDATPRTLYVRRDVVNADAIVAWAKAQGFKTTLPAGDMHVTITYSREPVDWMKMGSTWSDDDKGRLTIPPGGARMIEVFGEGAVVLLFNSSALSWRHEDMVREGASWDWPEYQPHITIAYEGVPEDLSKVEPYRGAIVLGPEVFEEVNEDWRSSIAEA